MIWPNITTVVNVVFQVILVLTKILHMGSSNRVTAQKKQVISKEQMQMIYDIPVLFE